MNLETVEGVRVLPAGAQYSREQLARAVELGNEHIDLVTPTVTVDGCSPNREPSTGEPAFGVVSQIALTEADGGTWLTLNFVDVPSDIAAIIRDGRYGQVQSQFYSTLPEPLSGSGPMLRTVRFLGGALPCVNNLREFVAHSEDSKMCCGPEVARRRARGDALIKKYAEAGTGEPLPAQGVPRADLLEMLAGFGVDVGLFPDEVPDGALAELVRVMSSLREHPEDVRAAIDNMEAKKVRQFAEQNRSKLSRGITPVIMEKAFRQYRALNGTSAREFLR